ncbi:MAG: PEP-CTERM sorting domain-containing protein [Syntrophorhabdales bacterium]|jgi:hypothetical protein
MKPIALFVALVFVFLGANLAYGMGGGGHHGDGRTDFLQKPGANDGSATNANCQDASRGQTDPPGDPTPAVGVSSVPEPVTLLLLGSALIGLVGLRRKARK